MPRARSKDSPTRTYTRRSDDQRIADLEARIEKLKAQARARSDPSRRHITRAIKAIDAATASTTDGAARKAFEEARTTLAAFLQLQGVLVPRNGPAASGVAPDAILGYVRSYPGQRGEQIAAALGTDTKGLRRPMKELIEAGQIKTKGERRGMQYWCG